MILFTRYLPSYIHTYGHSHSAVSTITISVFTEPSPQKSSHLVVGAEIVIDDGDLLQRNKGLLLSVVPQHELEVALLRQVGGTRHVIIRLRHHHLLLLLWVTLMVNTLYFRIRLHYRAIYSSMGTSMAHVLLPPGPPPLNNVAIKTYLSNLRNCSRNQRETLHLNCSSEPLSIP